MDAAHLLRPDHGPCPAIFRYDAHRNMRIKLPTDRLLLARKLVARRQLGQWLP